MQKLGWALLAAFVIIVIILAGVFGYNLGVQTPSGSDKIQEVQENKEVNRSYETIPATGVLIPRGAMKIEVQSLGNLPWDRMSGGLSPDEIAGLAGFRFPISDYNIRGEPVYASNLSATAQFKKVVFVVWQSYDPADRKLYVADNVDVQRWNTFGINSKDEYLFERFGDFYVFRDHKGNISFVAQGLTSSSGGNRVQSFVNVPWADLSGTLTLDEVARTFTFPELVTADYPYYNPEKEIDNQIIGFNFTEGVKRGWLQTDRAVLKQMIFVQNGVIYKAENVEIQPGNYPGGLTWDGVTPSFLLLTVKVGQSKETLFVLFFYDKDENLVAAGSTDKLPSTSFSGGLNGGTSSFSSPSSSSSSSPGSGGSSGGGPVGGVKA